MLASDFQIERQLSWEYIDPTYEKVEKYLHSLSKIQRQLVEMKMEEMPAAEIKKKLELTNRKFEDHMQSIRQNRWIAIFNKGRNEKIHKRSKDTQMV